MLTDPPPAPVPATPPAVPAAGRVPEAVPLCAPPVGPDGAASHRPVVPDDARWSVGAVVGEVENRLAVVIAYTQLLRGDPTFPAAHAADLSALESAAREAAVLIRVLLPRLEA